MSSSTTNLDLISSSQAAKEVTANALFDAESPAALYGRRASTTANLTWGYYGGAMSVNGVVTAIPNGTKTLTNGATNYLEADPTTGNVSVNTSNFTAANIPLYSVVTAGNLVASYTDYRVGPGFFADKGGSGSQAFMAGFGSQANHVARIDQISLMPTVASNSTIDVFGAAGATIDLTGNVTVTGIVACTAAQVGSSKTVIPSGANGTSFTASANMIVDGATSGTFLMPHDAIIEVLATSTTTFTVRTVFATGPWTPAYALATPGTSSFGTYAVQAGSFTKIGNKVTLIGNLTGGIFSVGTGSGALTITGFPFTINSSVYGGAFITFSNAYVTLGPTHARAVAGSTFIRLSNASGATMTDLSAANCANALRTDFVAEYFV